MSGRSSRAVREEIDHPVIDVDGHFVEMAPVLHEEIVATLEELGGAGLRDRYLDGPVRPTDTSTILAGRTLAGVRDAWAAMPSWWGWPVENVRDRATAHLPALLDERLQEFGIDYTVLYPSMTLAFLDVGDPELSAALCRAANRHHARVFSKYANHMTVGALIPMHTPEIAAAELRYAVDELGCKAVVIAEYARRPIPKLEREHGALSPPIYRLDHFGIDSDYRRASTCASHQRFTARCSTTTSPARCRVTSTTTSTASRSVTSLSPNRSCSAAYPTASPTCASRSSKGVWRGPRCSTPDCSGIGRSATAARSPSSTRAASTSMR
jgi:hypothetical protein